jgi:protein involved in polysaccharide export with SLBB domain
MKCRNESRWPGRMALIALALSMTFAAVPLPAQEAAAPGYSQATDQQLHQLCQAEIAKHATPTDVESLGKPMGLAPEQIVQLKQCVAAASPILAASPEPPEAQSVALKLQQEPASAPAMEGSGIERRFHELDSPYLLFATPRAGKLEQFGYDVFSKPVSGASPANPSVGDDYLLGPDDELIVYVWGRLNQTFHLKIDRDGKVMVPQIGPVQVTGLNFAQAKKLIESRMSQITGIEVDLTMGQVRSIQVFVIGKVAHPGLYTVSALSHVSNALEAAGGIAKMGSLRRIELRRDNRLAGKIDLYDMLLRGDTSADVRINPRDVIFVPVIGPVVAIAGDIKSPGIYELNRGRRLSDVLRMAGGVTAFGYSQRVQVQRVQEHAKRVALDVNLARASAAGFAIEDGDLVKVFTVLPFERNTTVAKGNFNAPGTYEWRPGMRIADLVADAQGPADHTFFDYALVQRRVGAERKLRPLPVNLGAALTSPQSQDNLELRPEDIVRIYNLNEIGQLPTVSIRGEVRKPGHYPLTAGMTLRELIYAAGGLLENAARDRAQLTRTQISDGAVAEYGHIDVDLRRVLSTSDPQDVALEPSDEVLVQEASNWHAPWHVVLKGEIARPGPYSIHEGERLASVLEAGGGFRADAYPRAAVFIRKSVKQVQEDELKQARARLQRDIARLSLQPVDAGRKDASADTLSAIKAVLAQTEGQQALGRMVVHLSTMDELQQSADNIVMENGDTLVIPSIPASVQVLGAVYNPNAIVYQPRLRVIDYLQRGGGATDGGDVGHMYVIKASGEVLTDAGVREDAKMRLFPMLPAFSGGLMRQRLEPGDTIYVPEKLVYVSPLEYAKDMTQVIANSAMTFAVLGILASAL